MCPAGVGVGDHAASRDDAVAAWPGAVHPPAVSHFEDGKIAERWVVRDDLGMLKQLGAFGEASG